MADTFTRSKTVHSITANEFKAFESNSIVSFVIWRYYPNIHYFPI